MIKKERKEENGRGVGEANKKGKKGMKKGQVKEREGDKYYLVPGLLDKSLISHKSEGYENLILTVRNEKGSLKTCS